MPVGTAARAPGARSRASLGHEVQTGVTGVRAPRHDRLRMQAPDREIRLHDYPPTRAAMRSAASLRRSSGTVRLMRTKPSPLGP